MIKNNASESNHIGYTFISN